MTHIFTFLKKTKPIILAMLDLLGMSLIFVFSLLIRFEAYSALAEYLYPALPTLLIAVVVRLIVYSLFGMYRQLWRHAGGQELLRIVLAVSLSSVVIYLLNFGLLPLINLSNLESRGVLVIDWLLNICYLGGSRFTLRSALNWLSVDKKMQRLGKFSQQRRVLIVGGGDVGSLIVQLMQKNPEMGYVPIGFVDDDPDKRSKQIYGVSVMGDRSHIPGLVARHKVEEVIIAMPTAPQPAIDDVSRICAQASVPTRVIPSIYDLLGGTITIEQLRQWRPINSRVRQRQMALKEIPEIRNIMVTGGAGFMGSNFVHYLLGQYPNYRVVVYDKLTYAGNLDNLLGLKEKYDLRYVFVKGDICDYEAVAESIQRYDIDAIVNFAAETHVDRSLMNPDSFLRTNVYGTYTLLEAARQFDVLRYHQVSTDEVYGQVERGSFREDDPLETRSPYSASKASADLLVHAYHISFGLSVTITRASNNIGPYQYPEKAVPLFITNAIENQSLPVYGDGGYVRDYLHVLDHCRGVDFVLHKGVLGEIYNLGTGNEVTALDLAMAILDRLGKPHSLLRLVEDRVGQDRRYCLDCSKIKSLGWRPEYTFERALDSTIEWYLENEWWWRKIKNGEYWEYYERQYRERLEQAVKLELSKE